MRKRSSLCDLLQSVSSCDDSQRFLLSSTCFDCCCFVCPFSGEDGAEMSAAGQMETVLGVKGLDKVRNDSSLKRLRN